MTTFRAGSMTLRFRLLGRRTCRVLDRIHTGVEVAVCAVAGESEKIRLAQDVDVAVLGVIRATILWAEHVVARLRELQVISARRFESGGGRDRAAAVGLSVVQLPRLCVGPG